MNYTSQSHLRPPIYVFSPGFSPLSGGRICLHLLCHYLNETGFESYITTEELSGRLLTPPLTSNVVRAHEGAGRTPIVVYPEIVDGNPLNAVRIVRYLLNRPGARGGNAAAWSSEALSGQFILHFASEFSLPGVASRRLYIPIVDRAVFFPPPNDAAREGFLVYAHRVSFDLNLLPDWCRPFTVISMENPRTPSQLAELYRSSKGLIAFERTGAAHEALHCGCPVLNVLNPHFTDKPMHEYFGDSGMGWSLSEGELARARSTLPAFLNAHDAYVRATPSTIREVFDEVQQFFSMQ